MLISQFCLVGTFFFMWISLGWAPFSPVLLITRSLLFPLPYTLCLPTWSTSSSGDCWSLCPFSVLPSLPQVGQTICKKAFAPLFRWIPSLPRNHRSSKRVIKAKTLLLTPALQAIVEPRDPSNPPQALPPHKQDRGGHHLGLPALNHCPQSHTVTLDTFQVTPGSVSGAHMEEQQGVIEPIKPQLSCNSILDPSPQQAANLIR